MKGTFRTLEKMKQWFADTAKAFFDTPIMAEARAKAAEKESRRLAGIERTKRKGKYCWQWSSRHVYANTKSEARARFKTSRRVRLPIGANVVRVK